MSMLFAYMAGGEGWGLEVVLKYFVRGGKIFSTCVVCVCGGDQVQYLSFHEKETPTSSY